MSYDRYDGNGIKPGFSGRSPAALPPEVGKVWIPLDTEPEPIPPCYVGPEATQPPSPAIPADRITDAEAITHRLLLGIQSQLQSIAMLLQDNASRGNAESDTVTNPTTPSNFVELQSNVLPDVNAIWGKAIREE